MDKQQLAEALNRYFKHLELFGYLNIKSTTKLLLLVFLWHFLVDFQDTITEEDYKKIASIINCMLGNLCLLPYHQFILQSDLNPDIMFDSITSRESEVEELRQTELENRRVALI